MVQRLILQTCLEILCGNFKFTFCGFCPLAIVIQEILKKGYRKHE